MHGSKLLIELDSVVLPAPRLSRTLETISLVLSSKLRQQLSFCG